MFARLDIREIGEPHPARQGVAQSVSALASEARSRGFESRHPDQIRKQTTTRR